MKIIDFDGLFDEKLTVYMKENKKKYTAKVWENKIPKLYKKFGDTYIAKIKCTPKEYYAKMTDVELVQTLQTHLAEEVAVPDFLLTELENRGAAEFLLPLLKENETEAAYALHLLGDSTLAYDEYFSILEENRFNEDIRSEIVEIFRQNADQVKTRAYELYKRGVAKAYMIEILANVLLREDSIYEILMREFQEADEKTLPIVAGYLAVYGDERALPYLLRKIEDKSIGFVEFQELKYAIEALGGEYDEERDFTADKDYMAIENAKAKALQEMQNKE